MDEVEQLYVEDLDGDGVVDWEDCDATDPLFQPSTIKIVMGLPPDGDCDDTDAVIHLLVIVMGMGLIQTVIRSIAKRRIRTSYFAACLTSSIGTTLLAPVSTMGTMDWLLSWTV